MNPRREKTLSKNKKKLVNSGKPANISRIPFSISLRPSKEILVKSKFYKGKGKAGVTSKKTPKEYSDAQVSKSNIKKIINIKNNFPNLSAKKIEKVYKVLNKPKKISLDSTWW